MKHRAETRVNFVRPETPRASARGSLPVVRLPALLRRGFAVTSVPASLVSLVMTTAHYLRLRRVSQLSHSRDAAVPAHCQNHRGSSLGCKKYCLKHNNNHAERHNREIERRLVVLGAFQSGAGAQATLALRNLLHNYVMPHGELDGRTPAEAANMRLDLGENRLYGLIRLAKRMEMTIR